MRRTRCLVAPVTAASVLLVACAGTPSEAPRAAELAAGSVAASTAADRKLENMDRRRVVRNGQEYYCQKQGVTGSRTKVIENCLTRDQLLLVLDSAQEFHGDVTGGAGNATASQDANGAAMMGPMPMSVVR